MNNAELNTMIRAMLDANTKLETQMKELKEQNIKLQRELNYSKDCAMHDNQMHKEYIAELEAKLNKHAEDYGRELSNVRTRLSLTRLELQALELTNTTLRAKVDNNELANSAVWSNRLNKCRAENERFANAIRKDNKELKEQNTRLQIAANKLYEISCIIDR